MSRARKALGIVAMPFVAAGIYAWMLRAAYQDLKRVVARHRRGA